MNFEKVTEVATAIGTFLAGAYICYRICKAKIEEFLNTWHGSVGAKIPRQSKIDLEVLKHMEEIKEMLNADRVHVYEFHNGEHYANGRSALKVSCTYEVCRVAVNPLQNECRSIPISCMPKYIAKIIDNHIVDVRDIETIKDEMPATYNLKFSQGVRAFSNAVILNKQKEPVGFIEVQWFNRKNFTKNDYELLRLTAFIEESILNVENKK